MNVSPEKPNPMRASEICEIVLPFPVVINPLFEILEILLGLRCRGLLEEKKLVLHGWLFDVKIQSIITHGGRKGKLQLLSHLYFFFLVSILF